MAEKKKKPTEDKTPVDAVDAVDPAVTEPVSEEPVVEETPIEEPAVEEPVAEVVGEEPVAEPVVEESVAEVVAEVPAVEVVEEPAEAPVVEVAVTEPEVAVEEAPVAAVESEVEPEVVAEPVADEPSVEDPAVEEPAAAEAPAPAAEPAAPAPQSGPKVKKKRLPRGERPTKGRVVRVKAETRKSIVRLAKPEHERGRSQERQGKVISDAMEKTIVVKVDTIKAHRKYKKVVRRSNTFHAHDERNEAKVGDVVRIVETRPLSKTKRWRLAEIVEAAK
jgi:small subunit ribosomal protein S17